MRKQLGKIAVVSLLIVMAAGCSLGKRAEEKSGIIPGEYVVTASDDKSISMLIENYYCKLFALPPENYTSNSAAGTVPEEIKGFIAKRTIEEGEGNPEIGIHYPRFVSINGLTAVNYQIIKENGLPVIKSEFIGMNGNGYLYSVKIDLEVKCFTDSTFSSMYKEDAANRTYTRTNYQNNVPTDKMRLQAKYDVEITRENGEFKILKAVEAANQYGYKNRLFRFNNDFMSRLSYLNLEKDSSGSYINKKDGEKYGKEKGLIQDFFNSLKEIDSSRMNLLKLQWDKSQSGFQSLLDKFETVKGKESKEMMIIGADYKHKFDIGAFPLKPGMQQIVNFKNFEITPHPAYSDGNKKYIVKMEADVRQINGISDKTNTYKFDYYVTLSGNNDYLKISGIKLNGYFI